MFASCGNIDNPLEEITGSGSGGGGGSEEATGKYLVWNTTTQKLEQKDLPASYTKMDATQTSWSGTYIVEDDVEIPSDVTLSGDATIIIKDGKTLSLASDKKIEYMDATGYKLYIHAQSDGASAGKLVVSTTSDGTYPIALNSSLSIYGASVSTTATGAGNEGIYVADELNMYGGEIKSTATGAGIMVGNTLGTVNIYGGTVDAKMTGNAATSAIYVYGNMNIYNGTVKGSVTGFGSGISVAAASASSGILTIENGTVTGISSYNMKGINATTINITGGTVNAESGAAGCAIQCTTLNISGADTKVTATGSDGNSTILDAGYGIMGTVNIDGGDVTATGGNGAKGTATNIHGGFAGAGISGNVKVSGTATVKVTGGRGGDGYDADDGTGGPGGNGIFGKLDNASPNVTVTGGNGGDAGTRTSAGTNYGGTGASAISGAKTGTAPTTTDGTNGSNKSL